MEHREEKSNIFDVEQYIWKYESIGKLFTVLEDNYLVNDISRYNKDELFYEMRDTFPLIQVLVEVIGELLNDTTKKFRNSFELKFQ